ncbi:hypothetical protein C0993_000744 [Termitomyces sp. T159_Od127]|nr:hypothetical protein C0993_000744 [Termitomyces sp. T159_Od127]
MSSFFQQITPENRAKRAQDQALHYIDNIPPVIVNGEDITQPARVALRAQIESAHKTTLKAIQDRRSQFIGGLFAFFVLVHRTKKKYEAAITEFERHIWEKDDIQEFEKNQTKEVQTNPLEDMVRSAQPAAGTPSPQG